MKQITPLLFCCFACLSLSAQDFPVNGVVYEKGTNIRIANAAIINLRTKMRTTSNEIGVFQLQGHSGDTILVTKNNLLSQKVKLDQQEELIIFLIRGSTMLEEVIIKGQSKKEEMQAIQRDWKRNGSFFGGKPPLLLLNPLGGSPLTFFYELFGQTPARARRFNRYYSKELSLLETDRFFNKKLIMENTALREKDLDQFMLHYYPERQKTLQWNHYEAIQYIKASAHKYMDSLKLSQSLKP